MATFVSFFLAISCLDFRFRDRRKEERKRKAMKKRKKKKGEEEKIKKGEM